MGWTSDEQPIRKKSNIEKSTKILLGVIAVVVLIIILIIIMLINVQKNMIILIIDGKEKKDYDINKLISNNEAESYINIEEFAKLVGYEYHKGEYKSFSNEENKCYVKGDNETATFYLEDNIINKVSLDDESEEYKEHKVEKKLIKINDKLYATKEAIQIAFNVQVTKKENVIYIKTLDYIVKVNNNNALKWGYKNITEQNFENKKALLYDRLIVKKEDGLYKIIDCNNTTEIVPDKYEEIQFSESEQNFLVTNNIEKVGIINLEGKVEIDPIYDSITLLNKKKNFYIVEENDKFGIVESGKNKVISTKYDEIGCNITSINNNGTKKNVNSVITIEECDGIVVKKGDKYGVIDFEEKIIVPFEVDSIYSIENAGKIEYFMIYNGEELNIIDMLIEQGIIEDPYKEKEENKIDKNDIQKSDNIISNNNAIITNSSNSISNNIV